MKKLLPLFLCFFPVITFSMNIDLGHNNLNIIAEELKQKLGHQKYQALKMWILKTNWQMQDLFAQEEEVSNNNVDSTLIYLENDWLLFTKEQFIAVMWHDEQDDDMKWLTLPEWTSPSDRRKKIKAQCYRNFMIKKG